MSCVLSIAGRNLDIDEFILKSGLRGFVKKYKDESKSKSNNLGKQYSFVSTTISDADLNSLEKQIKDAITYLKKHKKKLSIINNTEEIEYATINFMIKLNSVSDKYFAQYVYMPKELIMLCGILNLGIEVAIV